MRINNNISAMNTSRQLGNVSGRLSRSMEKLSSGLRIARAADDAAGLAVSEKLRGQIRGVNAAVRAQQDSVSGLQVAEGALNEVSSMLTRAKELKIQRDGTSDSDAIAAINAEFTQIKTEITNIIENTEYNGNKLLAAESGGTVLTNVTTAGSFSIYTDINGTTSNLQIDSLSYGLTIDELDADASATVDGFESAENDFIVLGTVSITTGGGGTIVDYAALTLDTPDDVISYVQADGHANETYFDTNAIETDIRNISLDGNDFKSYVYTGNVTIDAGTGAGGDDTLTIDTGVQGTGMSLDTAINKVATVRGQIGSFQNRFEASIRNFEGTAENLQAAESRIRDVDMAKEMVGFTKDTIIQQAAQAMLVQANQLPQNIVGLLR
jgi:flagellin